MFARSLTRPVAVLGVAVVLAACSGTASPPPQSGGGGAPSVSSPVGSSEPDAAGGSNGFEGTITSSGEYSATWTVAPDMPADPFNAAANPSLTSDKGTFGNIKVETDGRLSFGSGATELTNNSYDGTGAKVTLNSSGQFVCAFTVDTDLKGTTDGTILHMSGSMTVHWHPESSGDLNCP